MREWVTLVTLSTSTLICQDLCPKYSEGGEKKSTLRRSVMEIASSSILDQAKVESGTP